MSLLEKENIINIYIKKIKKSTLWLKNLGAKRANNNIDIFLVIVIVVLVISPIIINLSFGRETASNLVSLYLSPQFEELFGKEMTEKLLREFEEKNPDLRIQLAENKEEADIIFFDEGEFNALIAAGALLELNNFTNYDSGTQQIAIPLISFMNLLFYNIDILSASGFNSPPKTREEFIAYSSAVVRFSQQQHPSAINIYSTAFSLSQNDRQALSRDFLSWIWANGGDFWINGDKPSLDMRTLINDITFFGTLYRDGLLAPGIFETTGDQYLELFSQGRLAMIIASSQVIPYLRKKMGDDTFNVTTIPYSPIGGRYNISLSALYAGININSIYPDEAWRFLVFLAEKSSFFRDELKAIPGMVSNIIPGDYVMDDPFYSKAWDIFESSRIVESLSGIPNAQEYENAFLEELQIFFESNRTAQQTAAAIQRRWDAIE